MRYRNNLQFGGIIWFKWRLTRLRAYLEGKERRRFGALSRQLLINQQGKRHVGHSYLHQWSIAPYDGNLNVKGQNLEVGEILKLDEIG